MDEKGGNGLQLEKMVIFSSSFLVYREKALETDKGLFFLLEIACCFLLVVLRAIPFLSRGPLRNICIVLRKIFKIPCNAPLKEIITSTTRSRKLKLGLSIILELADG